MDDPISISNMVLVTKPEKYVMGMASPQNMATTIQSSITMKQSLEITIMVSVYILESIS